MLLSSYAWLLAATASYVVAASASVGATPTDLPCPKGYLQFKLNFNDLGTNPSNKTHGVRENAVRKHIYGNLAWDPVEWQVINPGLRDVTNGFHNPNTFQMTTHQGKGALVTCQEYAHLATDQVDERFNLQSFWIRHQHAGAFKLEIRCDVQLSNGDWADRRAVVQIPARPYGEYHKVQLTQAQQKSFQRAESCDMNVTPHDWCADGVPCFGDKALLIDDLNYCWTSGR